MTTAPMAVSNGTEVLRHQARAVQSVVRLNVEGISHKESLIQPQPAGSCLNWVIGHLVVAYQSVFPLLEQEPGDLRRAAEGVRAAFVSAQGSSRSFAVAGTFGRVRQSVGAR